MRLIREDIKQINTPDKQIVFRAMEPTRGQAALLATSLPLHDCPTNFWSFPLTSPWQEPAVIHSLVRRRGKREGTRP